MSYTKNETAIQQTVEFIKDIANEHEISFYEAMEVCKLTKERMKETNSIPDDNLYRKLKKTFDFDSQERENVLSTPNILKAIGYNHPSKRNAALCNQVLKNSFDMYQRKTRGNMVYDMPPLKKN